MRNVNWDKVAASSGIAFVVLFVVSFLLPGQPPDPGDSQATWVAYTLDKTKELKISAMLFGLALVAFIWFMGSLGTALREAGEQRLAAVAFGSGVATAAIALVATSFQAAMAWRIAANEPTLTRAFADIQWAVMTLASFTVAAFIFATAIASWRARIFPPWYNIGSDIVALAVLFAGGALRYDGFYSPTGGYAFITLIASLVWIIVTSVFVMRRASAAMTASAPA